MGFSLTSSNSSINKNPANANKHNDKNLKCVIVELFPPYFVTKALIILEGIGSFLVVSLSHNRWHPSKADWTKGASVA